MSASSYDFDTIVIGAVAGVIGSACAYQLTRLTNRRTLLIEQFHLGHDRGSSHGGSRIVRYVQDYGEATEHYMPLIIDAYKEWGNLEELSGQKLLIRNGLLWLDDKAQTLQRASVVRRFDCQHEVLSGEEVAKRWPHLHYQSTTAGAAAATGAAEKREWWALWDPNGGTLLANKAIEAMLAQFVDKGGVVRDGERVLAIRQIGGGAVAGGGTETQEVLVATEKALYKARNVVVACGGWASKLVPELPVPYTPLLIAVHFWQVREGAEKDYTIEMNRGEYNAAGFPSPSMIMTYGGGWNTFYAIPCVDYADKVKVGVHRGVPITDMHRRGELTRPPAWLGKVTAEHIREHLPGLDPTAPAVEKTCVYAMTHDECFVVGPHPRWGNVLLAGPMAGTGFKFAPAIGRIMAVLAERGAFTDYDIRAFGVDGAYRQSGTIAAASVNNNNANVASKL